MFCSSKDSCKYHSKDHNESEQQYKEQILCAIYLHYSLVKIKKAKAITSINYDAKMNLRSLAWCKRWKEAAEVVLNSDTYSATTVISCNLPLPHFINR